MCAHGLEVPRDSRGELQAGEHDEQDADDRQDAVQDAQMADRREDLALRHDDACDPARRRHGRIGHDVIARDEIAFLALHHLIEMILERRIVRDLRHALALIC